MTHPTTTPATLALTLPDGTPARLPVAPAVYLLHFARPVRHARHFLGLAGARVPKLVRVAATRGPIVLARVWACATPEDARRQSETLRGLGGRGRVCPICLETETTTATTTERRQTP